jgi:tetratricopeptide (TPR) repeat protein
MPTFIAIRNGEVVDTLQGADPRGLNALAQKHAVVKLDPDAEREKAEGNKVRRLPAKSKSSGRAEALGEKAFTAGDYAAAVEHYTNALKHEPKSAVLYGNRSIAYLKLAAQRELDRTSEEKLRPKALQDAVKATELDERWPKGWVRLAEAMVVAGEDDQGIAPELRVEGKRQTLQGAQEALENAVALAPEGKVKSGAY